MTHRRWFHLHWATLLVVALQSVPPVWAQFVPIEYAARPDRVLMFARGWPNMYQRLDSTPQQLGFDRFTLFENIVVCVWLVVLTAIVVELCTRRPFGLKHLLVFVACAAMVGFLKRGWSEIEILNYWAAYDWGALAAPLHMAEWAGFTCATFLAASLMLSVVLPRIVRSFRASFSRGPK